MVSSENRLSLKQIAHFPALRRLNLSSNALRLDQFIFPPSLQRLEFLDLSHNNLATVPDGLRHLRALEDLNLEGNCLRSESLVVDMGSVLLMLAELPRLKRLNLS